MSERSRLLVPVTYGFSVRYLVPTGLLDRLAEVATPVVALGWDDDALAEMLAEHGVETARLPDAQLEHSYRMFRRRIGVLHQHRLGSVTSRTVRRARLPFAESPRSWAISTARRWTDELRVRRPGGAAAVEADEGAAVRSGTNVAAFGRFLRDLRVDAVLSLTPYHDQDALALWAARDLAIPSITSIISFDNPTTRDRMIVRSERVLVWNRFNADEVLRSYPDLRPSQVGVIGAPQFDLHRRPDLLLTDEEWRSRLSLPREVPILLYGAGPSELVPGEAGLVTLLDRAVSDGRLPPELHLLVRRHPNDPPEPWRQLASRLRHATVVDPWAPGSTAFRGWPSHDDLVIQMSTLAHSAVHVNVCSSMTLDGAMFDRPQVGPRFVPGQSDAVQQRIRSFYAQEHWQPIAASGGVANADDEAELVAAILDALERPDRSSAGRQRMVHDVLTFDDGASSERLVGEVAALLDRDR